MRLMTEKEVVQRFQDCGALRNGHFIGSSGLHMDLYVDKSLVTCDSKLLCDLARNIVLCLPSSMRVDAVVSPALGAITLGCMVAYKLSGLRDRTIRHFYAHKTNPNRTGQRWGFRESFHRFLREGVHVLIVEDVLHTGASVSELVNLCRTMGTVVEGVTALWNRGRVTACDLGDVPFLTCLVHQELPAWTSIACPLCRDKVPITRSYEHTEEP
jgi:orotate phosphoribosyltransferase